MQSYSSDGILPVTNSPTVSETNVTSARRNKKTQLLFWSAPIVYALNQANQASMAMRRKDMSLTSSLSFSAIALLIALAMNGQIAVEGINETVEILRSGRVPDDWPHMSRKKRNALIITALLIVCYVAFADGIQSDFYTSALPDEYDFADKINKTGWKILSVGMALSIGLTTAFAEGLSMAMAFQEAASEDETEQSISRKFAKAISFTTGIFGGIQDALSSFIGMATVFDVRALPSLISLGSVSPLVGLSDFSLNSRVNMKNLQRFFNTLSARYPELKEVLAFGVSAGCGLVMGYLIQNLFMEFFTNAALILHLNESSVAEIFALIISYGAAANEFLVDTGAAFDWSYQAIDFVSNKVQSWCQSAYQYFWPNPPDYHDEEEQQPFLTDYDRMAPLADDTGSSPSDRMKEVTNEEKNSEPNHLEKKLEVVNEDQIYSNQHSPYLFNQKLNFNHFAEIKNKAQLNKIKMGNSI